MLINRLSPTDQPMDKEVKYMLTADIDRMAKLVGIHPEHLRWLLLNNAERGQSFYGSARPGAFFFDFNEGDRANNPRRLNLSTTDVRLHGPYRVDASHSLVTVPLTVMHPAFVGDLQHETGVEYELIPHIKLTAPTMGGQSHYVFTNTPQPFRDFLLQKDTPSGFELVPELLGFDLVLLSDEPTELPTPAECLSVTDVQGLPDIYNVTYDFGFGVTLEYIYTSDMRDNLRINHVVSYKGEALFGRESISLLAPDDVLKTAIKHLNTRNNKDDYAEAEAIMRCLRDSDGYPGIGYHHS